MSPTVGRIVHFKLPDSHHRAGEVRPAIVVNANGGDGAAVNLLVFLDPANDSPLMPSDACSVSEGTGNRQWSWPPKV